MMELPIPITFVLMTIAFFAGFFVNVEVERYNAKKWCIERAETKEQVLKCNERRLPWEK